jgi:hypothetical protein
MRRWLPAIAAVVRRPHQWLAGTRAYVTHVPPGWFRRAPFLPVPDRAWIRFRLQTAYGDPEHAPDPDDVVMWLEWSRSARRLAG